MEETIPPDVVAAPKKQHGDPVSGLEGMGYKTDLIILMIRTCAGVFVI